MEARYALFHRNGLSCYIIVNLNWKLQNHSILKCHDLNIEKNLMLHVQKEFNHAAFKTAKHLNALCILNFENV